MARSPKWAGLSAGMPKLKPAPSSVIAMRGRVKRSNERRPRVSIVQTAGKAPMKLTKPKTQEANKAPKVENPASEKIWRSLESSLA